ncbi:MAG: ribbon-helix-helix domain-containing protein, partial [Alphaproteobacteria bacterium]
MLVNHNVTVSGHRTSVRLEPEMWGGYEEICRREGRTIHEICSMVDQR